MSSDAGSLMPSPFRYHSLATRTYWLSAFGMLFGSTTIAPYMPLAMCASTGFVPRDAGRVEIDGVRDRAAVRQRHLHDLALADVHDGARSAVAVERPRAVAD